MIQPVGSEEQEGEAITLDQVLAGTRNARLRVGGRFAGVSKVADRLDYLMGEIADHREIASNCKNKMRRLVGGAAADREIAKWLNSEMGLD